MNEVHTILPFLWVGGVVFACFASDYSETSEEYITKQERIHKKALLVCKS